MADEDATNKVRTSLKEWVGLVEQERNLKKQMNDIRAKKAQYSNNIMGFMKEQNLADFNVDIEGSIAGNVSRSVRTSRPPLRRSDLRTGLLIAFPEDQDKVKEFLRTMDGIPEGADDMSVGGTQRELLVFRVPKEKKTMNI